MRLAFAIGALGLPVQLCLAYPQVPEPSPSANSTEQPISEPQSGSSTPVSQVPPPKQSGPPSPPVDSSTSWQDLLTGLVGVAGLGTLLGSLSGGSSPPVQASQPATPASASSSWQDLLNGFTGAAGLGSLAGGKPAGAPAGGPPPKTPGGRPAGDLEGGRPGGPPGGWSGGWSGGRPGSASGGLPGGAAGMAGGGFPGGDVSSFFPGWGTYQAELFTYGAIGRKPAITTDPNKLEAQAKSKMTPESYAFLAGGAGERATMDSNRLAFRRWKLTPKMLTQQSTPSLRTELFGKTQATPLIFAPIGFQNIFHPDAEPGVAAVAAELGIPYCMSFSSSVSLETLAEASGSGDRWFQLYWPPSDLLTLTYLNRAKESGFSVLVVTLDATSLGWRPWDLDLGYMPSFALPASLDWDYVNTTLTSLSNSMYATIHALPNITTVADFIALPDLLFSPPPSWERLSFLRKNWDGPIVLKGIQDVEDAQKAAEAGMDGIVVSNHGGRQLDGAVGSLDVLPEIVEAVGDKLTVLFDSGVRTGADVMKAMNLGAKGVMVGRPWAYGLGIGGKNGARDVMRGILAELEIQMSLAGVKTTKEFNRRRVREDRNAVFGPAQVM